MKYKKLIAKYKFFFLFIVLVLFDQITKHVFRNKNIDLGLLAFTPVKNTGMSFGLLQNNNFLFIIISFLAFLLIIVFRDEFENKYLLTMLLAGITGNLLDRLFKGYVFDFINFKVWPVFNVADSLIVVSIILFVYLELKKVNVKPPPKKKG